MSGDWILDLHSLNVCLACMLHADIKEAIGSQSWLLALAVSTKAILQKYSELSFAAIYIK